jgi:hypothetical protein
MRAKIEGYRDNFISIPSLLTIVGEIYTLTITSFGSRCNTSGARVYGYSSPTHP